MRNRLLTLAITALISLFINPAVIDAQVVSGALRQVRNVRNLTVPRVPPIPRTPHRLPRVDTASLHVWQPHIAVIENNCALNFRQQDSLRRAEEMCHNEFIRNYRAMDSIAAVEDSLAIHVPAQMWCDMLYGCYKASAHKCPQADGSPALAVCAHSWDLLGQARSIALGRLTQCYSRLLAGGPTEAEMAALAESIRTYPVAEEYVPTRDSLLRVLATP